MATITQNILIDLNSKRIVRENNHLVGLRSYSFTEGNTYIGEITLIKDGAVYEGDISSVVIEVGNSVNDVALVRFDGTTKDYSLTFTGDLLRQYLYNEASKDSIFSVGLTVDSLPYVIDSVSTVLIANPSDNTGGIPWDNVTGKPSTFTPSAHTQAISTVDGLGEALNAKADASSLSSHTGNTSNPHSVTKTQVGLGNVDNTSDANKPVSTAQQTALNLKANTTHTHTAAQVVFNGTDMVVSDAGTTNANGTYTQSGTIDGKPSYVKGIYSIQWISSYYNQWRITDGQTILYYGADIVATPDLVTAWYVNQASTPAPTVALSTTNLNDSLSAKVDKVTGKQLSTEDYTTAEKTKLSGIEAGAQVNTVTSVAGRTGAVTLSASDISSGTLDDARLSSNVMFQNASKVTDITYADLITARDAGTLIAGSFYRITDFRSIYLNNVNEICGRVGDVVESVVEPLVVLAITSNKLSSQAFSESYPTDVIYYDPDLTYIDGTVTALGFITYRWETRYNIECYYDWRNVKFKRWGPDKTGISDWTSSAYSLGATVYNPSENTIFACIKANSDASAPTLAASYNWCGLIDYRAKLALGVTVSTGNGSIATFATDAAVVSYHYTFCNYNGTALPDSAVQNVKIDRALNTLNAANYSGSFPNNVFYVFKAQYTGTTNAIIKNVSLIQGAVGNTFNLHHGASMCSSVSITQSTACLFIGAAINIDMLAGGSGNVVIGYTTTLNGPSVIRFQGNCVGNLIVGRVNNVVLGDSCRYNIVRSNCATSPVLSFIQFGANNVQNLIAPTGSFAVGSISYGASVYGVRIMNPSAFYGLSVGDRIGITETNTNYITDLTASSNLYSNTKYGKSLFKRGTSAADVRLQYYTGTDTPTIVQANT